MRDRAAPVSRVFKIVFFGLVLTVVGAVAVPALLAEGEAKPAACEPQSWIDWHVAMKKECLTPAYVCHNMTASKLLEDPDLAAAYRAALQAGDPAPLAGLDELVGRMRASYGCGDTAPAGREPSLHGPARRLPPGHPPVPGGGPRAPVFTPGPQDTLTI
jgi:hypothetical protein